MNWITQPEEIERKSFEIISSELKNKPLDPIEAPIIKRVIHTTADFDYADHLRFSANAVPIALDALKKGAHIITDTRMVFSGINKKALARFGGEAFCFMDHPEVVASAAKQNITRAALSMIKASKLVSQPAIFAIGNAPTALIELERLMQEENLRPSLIIGVPVGFVNVVEAKELIMKTESPFIVSSGRKGGSTVAAAICNALLYLV